MFIVFSNRCMHLGCPVSAPASASRALATAAQYDTEGKRIAGPPIRPLDRFQWEIKNSTSSGSPSAGRSTYGDGKMLYFPVKMPGQPVRPRGR